MRVAVTGATGFVGWFVIKDLVRRGHEVHALKRPQSIVRNFPESKNLQWFTGTLADTESLKRLLNDGDGLVHLAFEHVPGRYRGGEGDDPAHFYAVNVDQTIKLLELLPSFGVTRTVFLSSRAVYDGIASSGGFIEDGSTVKPTSAYATAKVEVEDSGHRLASIGFTSLRATGVYGLAYPEPTNKWFDLTKRALHSSHGSDTFANQLRTEVHGDDVASAVHLLLTEHLDVEDEWTFNCSDIAVSEAQIVACVRSLKRGLSPEQITLPESALPQNAMSCSRLSRLGWRPGGMKRFYSTMQQFMELHKANRDLKS